MLDFTSTREVSDKLPITGPHVDLIKLLKTSSSSAVQKFQFTKADLQYSAVVPEQSENRKCPLDGVGGQEAGEESVLEQARGEVVVEVQGPRMFRAEKKCKTSWG